MSTFRDTFMTTSGAVGFFSGLKDASEVDITWMSQEAVTQVSGMTDKTWQPVKPNSGKAPGIPDTYTYAWTRQSCLETAVQAISEQPSQHDFVKLWVTLSQQGEFLADAECRE